MLQYIKELFIKYCYKMQAKLKHDVNSNHKFYFILVFLFEIKLNRIVQLLKAQLPMLWQYSFAFDLSMLMQKQFAFKFDAY